MIKNRVCVDKGSGIINPGEYAKETALFIDRMGNKAIIPEGWTVSGLVSETEIFCGGLVIYKIPKDCVVDWDKEATKRLYDQMVWVPSDMLKPNGTLDGRNFNEKLGRRKYYEEEFSYTGFNEENLFRQKIHMRNLGGCYVSRYDISMQKGKPRSVKNEIPWSGTFWDAVKIAENFKGGSISYLVYGAEFDTIIEWLVSSNAVRKEDLYDSSNIGNYSGKLVVTGTGRALNNLYDFAGNLSKWTQESFELDMRVLRGGSFRVSGKEYSMTRRTYEYPDDYVSDAGVRVIMQV